ncbi:OLC1v1007086C1 [Oldenlandia corymbosa var. corymbosa]|uniref:Poly [ADP-ribose] polymerase n=1 Tax=Oldenlandia corymbosa var. corymbosa TaxID=529605 RepID=A0AAV1DJ48_OLDCO|nr:OLC1v1007086C1 [Oldenlandia corymbosa var. corymbosa]
MEGRPPPLAWKAEYAKSSRSSCKTCRSPIDKEELRLGKMVQATQFDGFMPLWNHAGCILRKKNQIKSADDVAGLELLRWGDQQRIRNYVEGDGSSNNSAKAPALTVSAIGIDISPAARSSCKHCGQKIKKGLVRISTKPDGQGSKSLAWHHANCYLEVSPTTQVHKLLGWDSLSPSDQEAVLASVKPVSSVVKDEETLEELKPSGKRKRADSGKTKLAKGDMDIETTKTEDPFEAQTNAFWILKDDLKKYVSTAELRQMLEINDQCSTGNQDLLLGRCADGMLFGARGRCPICGGHLHYSAGMYKCHDYLSEWGKCSYSTTEPNRFQGKWKIPEGTSNEYLLKWYKTQKAKKPARILPPTPVTPTNKGANGMSHSSKSENLGDLKVAISGVSNSSLEMWKTKIEEAGGEVHQKIQKGVNCLVVSGDLSDQGAEMRKARRMKLPILREQYLADCVERIKKLPFDLYKIEAIGEKHSTVVVKVKGRSAVHESSGLQDSGHILEDGNSIYNTTLSLSDLSTGVNSYYILQIIEDDKGSDCHVFRKWGRVGNDKIGGIKLDEMDKVDAIEEFKRLFLEKTGNSWEAWESKKDFQKRPGRFYPLDIDYGADTSKRKTFDDSKSQLVPALQQLMKMLFNVETYRAAMREFEINMSEMPLGKLSKSNIQKGFEALTEIQNLLEDIASNPSVKESLIIAASNRFFTLIPSIHPHVIRDEDDFKSKVKMLEALQDIEIASRLVGFNGDNDDSLDRKYEKLRCQISPLSPNSEDYRLIEKYLHTTHAPTHTEWSLELEEVFALEREGEYDKYSPHRTKLGNKMLLWHGSRLTNFVGILSQGLRIAPPEAPATGYMFGKGVYFADLVSKSAQYCFTRRDNPVGLMLLSEVALGEMYELKNAKYVEKLPRGKHSTKGLGKTVPQGSGFVKWRDDVVVPCGKPVPSSINTSELMYNEYIVYDTAQVKLQFLLKVRFHHKH